MNRRDLMRTALIGTGAAAAAPAAPLVTHIAAAAAATAPAAAEEQAWAPLLFDAHQNATVIALTELIIPATDTPGAKAAKVNEYIDLMLHDVEEDRGHGFLKALGWLDGYALDKYGAPFVKLSEPRQTAILASLDGAQDPALMPGAEFFKRLKRLTVEGYYTSKIGIDELNKDGVPDTFACAHESHA